MPDFVDMVEAAAKRRENKHRQNAVIDAPAVVELTDFYAFMPMHSYIFAPARQMWPGASVNARIPPVDTGELDDEGKPVKIKASLWLDQNRPVEQMSWLPGEPMLVRDHLIADSGWVEREGATVFNLYRSPVIEAGDPRKAERWLDHVSGIYPEDHQHIVRWLAHRVQFPGEKVNHALLLGGSPGIGKDTILYPVAHAIGPWNMSEVTPIQLLGRFNGFVKSVILRINEARDLGDINRYAFYEHLKPLTAAPPEHLRCDEKGLREYYIPNVTGVIVTSNYKTDGCFLPPDDRRHYVAWSSLTDRDLAPGYFESLYRWFDGEGARHVAAYLASLDLTGFNAKAPPPKTAAFWEIVDAHRAPEESELADIIDRLTPKGKPPPAAITIERLLTHADASLGEWLRDRKNRRIIPKRLEKVGYVPIRNDTAEDGLWKIRDKRQAVYGRFDLSLAERLKAARKLTAQAG
jgi:hypothetical protein